MTLSAPLLETEIPDLPSRRGKVRDVYELDDRLIFIATDRISAFDWVMPNGIPDKGRVLNLLSQWWFDILEVPHHCLTTDITEMPLPAGVDRMPLAGRTMLVRRTDVIPVECVARGYLAGSGWKEYQQSGTVCGIPLPSGLQQADRLPTPIFTPATKAETGHDENISFEQMESIVGRDLADQLREKTLAIYTRAATILEDRGLLLADTKFEFGLLDGEVILIDEVLTPDSSRFWPADQYAVGQSPPSFDKQFVRDWLETTGWDKASPPPSLPDDVVLKTRAKYVEAFERLVGTPFPYA